MYLLRNRFLSRFFALLVDKSNSNSATPNLTEFGTVGQFGLMPVRQFLHRHWFTLAIPSVVLSSKLDPSWMRNNGKLQMERWKDSCVMSMFFLSGLSVGGVSTLTNTIRAGGVARHVAIQGFSLLAMPCVFAATFPLVAKVLSFSGVVVSGTMFMACLPTTIGLGVVLTRAAGGDTLLAVLHATLGNSVGAAVTPLTSAYFSGMAPNVDNTEIAVKLMKLIFIPGALGMAARALAPAVAARHAKKFSPMQQCCLLMVLGNVFSNCFSNPVIANSPDMTLAAVTRMLAVMGVYNLGFFGTAWVLFSRGRLFMPVEQRIAACFCATQKTAAMGVPMLSVLHAGDPNLALLLLPLLTYHPMQILCGSLLGPRLAALRR
jgi:sodium/bile acid cotransporter 7